jgi:hypothetical protein
MFFLNYITAVCLLPLARCTEAVKLQLMVLYFESLLPRHIVLECFNALILKFDDRTASGADKVVVMGVGVLILKEGDAILNTVA